MSTKSHILFSIFSIVALIAAGGINGFSLLLIFAAATVFLVHMSASTMAWLCRPLAPVYCRHKPRHKRHDSGGTPW